MRVDVAQVATPSLSPCSSPSSLSSSSRSAVAVGSLPSSKSVVHGLQRSCSAIFDGHDFPPKPNHHHNRPLPKTRSFRDFRHLGTHVDVLEPSFLGIKPEPPQWPAREAVIRDCIARRASCVDLPFSLRMLKLKQRVLKLEGRESEELGEKVDNLSPIGNLCYSSLSMIREIQNQAFKIRGLVLDEDLDGIASKAQKEMTFSFVWLFREVFAKTPDLMFQILLLTSNFAALSLEACKTHEKISEKWDNVVGLDRNSSNWGVGQLELGKPGVPSKEEVERMEERELGLWRSMVEEANEMKLAVEVKDEGLGYVNEVGRLREDKLGFVSPVKVEIDGDEYEEYYRTNLLYQSGLSQDPSNPLLLSNYAQFLWLVFHDYDRAEECFKRAIQLDPSDAEVVSQYANFLWLVRKDLWGAEERYQQAMAAEPDNSHHASRYASFLWSTGGEDTCYPLDHPQEQEQELWGA